MARKNLRPPLRIRCRKVMSYFPIGILRILDHQSGRETGRSANSVRLQLSLGLADFAHSICCPSPAPHGQERYNVLVLFRFVNVFGAARTDKTNYFYPYWRKRLEDRKYDAILFRNGYAKDSPEMLVEFRGLRRYGQGRDAYYAIRLGQILRIKSWSPECPCILWRFNVPSMHFISLSAGPIFLRQGKIACSDNSAIAPSFPRRLMVPATVSSFRSP